MKNIKYIISEECLAFGPKKGTVIRHWSDGTKTEAHPGDEELRAKALKRDRVKTTIPEMRRVVNSDQWV